MHTSRIQIAELWVGVYIFEHERQNYSKQCMYVTLLAVSGIVCQIHTSNFNIYVCNILNPMPYHSAYSRHSTS